MTEEVLEHGSLLRVSLAVDDPPLDLAFEGEVVDGRDEGERREYDLTFSGLDQETKATLTRFVFLVAKRTGGGSWKEDASPSKGRDGPGTLESALREDVIPAGASPAAFVDSVKAATVQLILEGDETARARYPQTSDMLEHWVQQRALEVAHERRGAGSG